MLKKIIKDFIKKTNKDTAIIHLRVHLPNKNDKYNYKTPRWHTDGKYFPNMKYNEFLNKNYYKHLYIFHCHNLYF